MNFIIISPFLTIHRCFDRILEDNLENPISAKRGGRGDAQLRIPMPEMQQEIHSDSQHSRARCSEGKMPKMRWEKTGTTHHGFSDKNLQQELVS